MTYYYPPSARTNHRKRRTAQDNASPKYIKRSDFVLAEYNTLRTEILQRISTRYQLISITLTVFGAVFAIGNPYLAMLYPVLAFVLLFFYSTNSDSIQDATNYIRSHIETEVTEDGKKRVPTTSQLGWYTYKFFEKKEKNRIIASLLAGRLVFPISGLIAWVVGNTLNTAKSTNVPPIIITYSLVTVILSFIVALLWSLFRNFSRDEIFKPK